MPKDQSTAKRAPSTGFASAQQLFQNYAVRDKNSYVSQEFQDFGYRLAVELDDLKHKSLYIKLSKSEPRAVLENALSFVSDAPAVKSKAKLFMWKLQQLRQPKLPQTKKTE